MEYEKQFYNHADKSDCNKDHLSEISEVILVQTGMSKQRETSQAIIQN